MSSMDEQHGQAAGSAVSEGDRMRAESIVLLSVQFIIIISLLGVVAFVDNVPEEVRLRDEREYRTISWKVLEYDDNWVIEIIEVESEILDEVSWRILNEQRLVETWDDPAGDTLRMEGDLIDINFTLSDYNNASVTHSDKFHSRDPIENRTANHTLCIVFMDVDTNGKLSNGDVIWIRSDINGGAAADGYRFRLVNERGGVYGEKVLEYTGKDTYPRSSRSPPEPAGEHFWGAIVGSSALNGSLILLLILPFRFRESKPRWSLSHSRRVLIEKIVLVAGVILISIPVQSLLIFNTAFTSDALYYKPSTLNWVYYVGSILGLTFTLRVVILYRRPSLTEANTIVVTSLLTAIMVPSFAKAIGHDPLWWLGPMFAIVSVNVLSAMLVTIKCRSTK